MMKTLKESMDEMSESLRSGQFLSTQQVIDLQAAVQDLRAEVARLQTALAGANRERDNYAKDAAILSNLNKQAGVDIRSYKALAEQRGEALEEAQESSRFWCNARTRAGELHSAAVRWAWAADFHRQTAERQLAEAQGKEDARWNLLFTHYQGEDACPDPTDACWGCSLREERAENARLQAALTEAEARGCKAWRWGTLGWNAARKWLAWHDDEHSLRLGAEALAELRGEALGETARKLHHTEEHMLAFEDCYAAVCLDARAAIAMTPAQAKEKEGR